MPDSAPEAIWFEPSSPVLQAWKRAMDSMLQGDRSLAVQAFAEDAVWYDMFVGTVHSNKLIAEHLSTSKGRHFDTSSIEVISSLESGETAAVEWIQTLHTGARTMRLEGTSWVAATDGRLTRLWDYVQPLKNRKP